VTAISSLLLWNVVGVFMAICPKCNQQIQESIVEGRKLIAQVHMGPYSLPNSARYVTVFLRKCACGEQIERRYENIPSANGRTVIIS
jgi:hypothetical protein